MKCIGVTFTLGMIVIITASTQGPLLGVRKKNEIDENEFFSVSDLSAPLASSSRQRFGSGLFVFVLPDTGCCPVTPGWLAGACLPKHTDCVPGN